MAENSKIEWTDATWNPITGCSVVSPGCTHCYAMRLAGTRLRNHPSRQGLTRLTKAGPVWTGEVRLNEDWLDQPLRWRRPRRIFVCAHGDLFHEAVPDEWIDRVFAVMALSPQHTFQVLTKRPARMLTYLSRNWAARVRIEVENLTLPTIDYNAARAQNMLRRYTAPGNPAPLPNVWLGTSAEDQPRADERIPYLAASPAARFFVSAEPLLGAMDLSRWIAVLDWVIVGGESGPGARPMHPDWARSLRDQCQAAGAAFHFKQWGNYLPDSQAPREEDGAHTALTLGRTLLRIADEGFWSVGKARAGRMLDGRTWDEMPEVRHG